MIALAAFPLGLSNNELLGKVCKGDPVISTVLTVWN